MKLKILYVCYQDISGYNGAIRHVMEMVKGFSKNGHKVTLSVPKFSDTQKGMDIGSNVKIRYIPTIPLPVLRPLSYFFLALLYLPLLCFCLRPDVIYIRDINFTVLPVLLAKICRIPCIIEINGLLDEASKIQKVAALTFFMLDIFRHWNLRKADHIITVTDNIKKELVRQYGVGSKKISIITNGVDLKLFKPVENK